MSTDQSFTDEEKVLVKNALVKFKRFWTALPDSVNEGLEVDAFIDAMVELISFKTEQFKTQISSKSR